MHWADLSCASHCQQLGFIQHVIAADEDSDGPLETFAFLRNPHTNQGECLDLLFRRDTEVLRDLFDGLHPWRVYQFGRAVSRNFEIFDGLKS